MKGAPHGSNFFYRHRAGVPPHIGCVIGPQGVREQGHSSDSSQNRVKITEFFYLDPLKKLKGAAPDLVTWPTHRPRMGIPSDEKKSR